MKFAVKHLPKFLHPDEHVKGAVYGRHGEGGLLGLEEGLLVATDHRILFIDYKPLYTNVAELTYDVVSGVRQVSSGFFAGLTLHTRIGDFALRYVNARCAAKFVSYIEQRRLKSQEVLVGQRYLPPPIPQTTLDEPTRTFLRAHDTAVLSTIDRNGETHDATVHYLIGDAGDLFILAKADTGKVHNIYAHERVAVTVYDADALQTAQLDAVARIEPDRRIKDWVWRTISQPRIYGGQQHVPPVTNLRDGAFAVIRITPVTAHFSDFN